MRKAMAASALIHFGLIAGAWAAMSLPPAVDESDAESVSVSIISMDMVSTDPSEVVTQTSQTLVSAGEEHEAMEVPEGSEAETAEAVEPEIVKPVERVVAGAAPETGSEVAKTEDLVSAEVLTASTDSPQPVEAAIPQVASEAAIAVVETVTAKRGTAELAKAYLDFLYTPEGQKIIAKHGFRPRNEAALAEAKLPAVKTFRVEDKIGSWADAQKKHFADGGVFDQIATQ